MSTSFNRHDGIPADVQLDIINRAVCSFHITQLPAVNSLSMFEAEYLKLKAKKYRTEHYVTRSRRRNNFMEPNSAFPDHSPSVLSTTLISSYPEFRPVIEEVH